MSTRFQKPLGFVVLFVLCAGAVFGAEGDGRYHIELTAVDEALVEYMGPGAKTARERRKTNPDATKPRVEEVLVGPLLILERIHGEWEPAVYGDNPATRAIVRSAERQGDAWKVTLDGLVGGLPRKRDWLKEHNVPVRVHYELTFRANGGKIAGTVKGAVGEKSVSGAIAGEVDAHSAVTLPPPPSPGEHPRFLFRKEQLPALKKKAQTAWGRAMLKHLEKPGWSRSRMAVGQGLLYQLTGDRKHADKARELIDVDIKSGWWATLGPIHDPAHKATEAMIAYDLIYDACDEAYRKQMREFLQDKMRFMYDYAEINSGNGNPHSNWSAQYRVGVGMIALMLLADPAPLPDVPPEWEVPVVAAPQGFAPGEGVPVLPLEKAPLREWLMCPPLNIGVGNDGLAALGGERKATPAAGVAFKTRVKEKEREDKVCGKYRMQIEFKNARPRPRNPSVKGDDLQPLTRETSVAFGPVPQDAIIPEGEYRAPKGWIQLWRAAGLKSFQTLYFFAVLDVSEARTVQVKLGGTGKMHDWIHADSSLIISGRRFRHADICRLEPGKHPALRKVTISMLREAHGRDALYDEVIFSPVDDAVAARAVEIHRLERQFLQQRIQAVTPRFKELGSPDIHAMLWLPLARRFMDRYGSTAIGEKGWHCAGQCYTQHPMLTALPFQHAYRNATGTDVGEHQHLGWFLGQAAARTVFSGQWARMQDYGRGDGPVGVDVFGRGFGVVPDEIKPAVFEAWKKTLDLTDKGLFDSPEIAVKALDPMSAAFTFVNWPMEGATPVAPRRQGIAALQEGALPLALVDKQRLGYSMRNAFKDGDDIVASFTGFDHPGGDWGCEGAQLDWRLLGLGDRWVEEGMIWNWPNRVGGFWAARVFKTKQKHLKTWPDGSACISMGYTTEEPAVTGDGLRCFAVDYSGKAGVPALVVIVDKVILRNEPHYPKDYKPPKPKKVPKLDAVGEEEAVGLDLDADPQPKVVYRTEWRLATNTNNVVKVGPRGFEIKGKEGGTLAGTVVGPSETKVTTDESTFKIEMNYRFDHTSGEFTRKRIQVHGNDFYFVVMTLGKGPPPKVTVTGKGEKAIAKVGGQTVRFDGEKIVLGQPPLSSRPR